MRRADGGSYFHPSHAAYLTEQAGIGLAFSMGQLYEGCRMYRLEVKFQNLTMKEYIPQDKRTLTVGRHRDNDIVLRDSSVSRHHSCFTKEGKKLVVTDKGSKNGTIVNGLRVESVRLEDGDVIRIGDNLVIVVSVVSSIETYSTITGEHARTTSMPNTSV